MLYEILLIFICLFAALGIVDLAVYIFNRSCIKRLPPHRLYIMLDDFEESDAEYLAGFLVEYFLRCGDYPPIDGIIIGDAADPDGELRAQLRTRYKDFIL